MHNHVQFSTIQGSILEQIRYDSGALIFYTSNGAYWMGHHVDCCEHVSIADVCGNPYELYNSYITLAEESNSSNELGSPQGGDESAMWTFYRIQTPTGDLTIRWFSSSNGYYSVSVDFVKMNHENIIGDLWSGRPDI